MSDRLDKLQTLLQKSPADPFLLYAIALEHKTAGNTAAAEAHLLQTVTADPGYCYAYYQLGEVREQAGNTDGAIAAYRDGVAQARKKGDTKALGELQQALDILGG